MGQSDLPRRPLAVPPAMSTVDKLVSDKDRVTKERLRDMHSTESYTTTNIKHTLTTEFNVAHTYACKHTIVSNCLHVSAPLESSPLPAFLGHLLLEASDSFASLSEQLAKPARRPSSICDNWPHTACHWVGVICDRSDISPPATAMRPFCCTVRGTTVERVAFSFRTFRA